MDRTPPLSRRRMIGRALSVTLATAVVLSTAWPASSSSPWHISPGAGMVREAPTPTGTEALVWSNGDATTTVRGAGRVVVHARADLCDGGPLFDLIVGGQQVGSAQVVNDSSGPYWEYPVGPELEQGDHTVTVRFTNDRQTATCDRNLHIGWVSLTGAPGGTPPAPSGNPFLAGRPYVDPTYPSVAAADALRGVDPAGAAELDKISSVSAALWVGDWIPTSHVEGAVRTYTTAAAEVGETGVLVVYAIPARDCGLYSEGGLTPETYPAFVRAVADGLHGTRTAVVLEPDAVAQLGDCAAQGDRAGLLREAVTTLGAAGATVYLDGGNSAWIDVATMAERLEASGISGARGFATNISNFRSTADERAYAEQLAAVLDTHYVIDTSRNGNGPLGDGPLDWCNPSGRALGERPGAVADAGPLDAHLYIKRVGESDGECDRGNPPAGEFWVAQAIELARNAVWWR